MKQSDITPELINVGETLRTCYKNNPEQVNSLFDYRNESGLSPAHAMALAGHRFTDLTTLEIKDNSGFSVNAAMVLFDKVQKK